MSYLFLYESSIVLPAVAWEQAVYLGSREKSCESSTQKDTRPHSLAIRGKLASRLLPQLSYGSAATLIN